MNKKVTYTIIGIMFIMFIIVLIIFKDNINPKEETKKEDYSYLIIGDDTTWKKQDNNKWINVSPKSINDEPKNIWIDNKYFGKYKMKYINSWNLMDNTKYINYDGKIIAASPKMNLQINEYNIDKIEDDDLKEINIIMNKNMMKEEITYQERVNIDLDNNGILDKIINVSNLNDEGKQSYFSLLYVSINNKNQVLIKENIEEKDYYNAPMYYLNYILNIDKEKSSSLVIEKGYFSNAGKTSNILYQYINGKYEISVD